MASARQQPYIVTRDLTGRVDEIRDVEGVVVPKDPHDQRYCDFLTWASHFNSGIDEEQFPFICPSFFFCTIDRLRDHCRSNGQTLATSGSKYQRRFSVADRPWRDSRQTENFRNLFTAAPAPPDVEFHGEDGLVHTPSMIWVTSTLYNELNQQLQSDDTEMRRLSSWPVHRSFVTFDVSDYSEYPTGHQLRIIQSLIHVVTYSMYWNIGDAARVQKAYEDSMCIGDGYIYAFARALDATQFAAHLARLIEVMGAKHMLSVQFHFRIGLHFGPVYSFWDPGRNGWNYSGSGINGSRRVLEAIGKDRDDMIFMSGEFKDELVRANDGTPAFRAILGTLQNRGRHRDKHGNPWRVYELNHTAVATLPCDLDQPLGSPS